MTIAKTLLLAVALAHAPGAPAVANCGAAADRDPGAASGSPQAAQRATLCLLNVERRKDHERRLRFDGRLAAAGLKHAQDMVQNHYFAHTTPSGQDFVQRIMNTDYVPATASWRLGENLAWGELQDGTPRQIVRAWMASPDHRRNILDARFRQVGIAIVVGTPVGDVGPAATYATEFGAIGRR